MILIFGDKFEKFRRFLMSGSGSNILEAGSLQIITEQRKEQELLLLNFDRVEVSEGSTYFLGKCKLYSG